MTIETKYNILDVVYHLHGIIKESKIRRINIQVVQIDNPSKPNGVIVNYELYDEYRVSEKDLYSTKEEAGIAWLKAQGLDCGLKGN